MEKSSLKPGHLRRIKSLAPLDDAQLAAFINYAEVVNLAQGTKLFQEGQPGDSMFLILEGELRVVMKKQNSHEDLLLRVLHAGEGFGEIALLNHTPRSATVEATQTSVLIKISSAALQSLVTEQPALAAQFLHHIAKTLGRQLSETTVKLRTHFDQVDVLSHIH